MQHIQEQMMLGPKHEREHTNDPDIAWVIAKDHILENPNYYTMLEKMEKSYKK